MSSHAHRNPRERNNTARRDVPLRPKTPADYTPEPFHKLAPANVHEQLMSEHQKGEAALVHRMPLDRFKSFGQVMPPPQSPSATVPSKRSTAGSFQSLARATGKGMAKGLDLGRAALERTRPAIETAVNRGKQVVAPSGGGGGGKGRKDEPSRKRNANPSTTTTTTTTTAGGGFRRSLYFEPYLPRLVIPDATAAAAAALGSACSTDTTRSASWTIEGLSPTSRELRHLATEDYSDDDGDDVVAEIRNMISARRRVRKAPFGRDVGEHCRARPGWDDAYPLRREYAGDRSHLEAVVAALQRQKDAAQDMAKRAPARYPGLRPVRKPRCTDKVYWQHRSY
ncbi:hypothetical protein F4809DRAFT_492969 [Biscogniauxia mediterranea]|nr:hypothetical protein F4809DRAFT_492969 [Biscogniauxia mediterranea]